MNFRMHALREIFHVQGEKEMKLFSVIVLTVLLLPLNGIAGVSDIRQPIQDAMKTLGLEKDADVLGVLTNARYVQLDGKDTEQ